MKKAITIVEVLVIIAIVGILVGVSLPVISHFVPGIQLSGTARTLTSNLREAQEKAITEQKQHLIRFFPTASPRYYVMVKVDGGSEEELERINLPSGEDISLSPSIADNQIIFSADGGPSSSGDIVFSLQGKSKTVNVSPAGFIKISS